MIEESKHSSDMIKHFNKELVMAKEDNENFNNSTKGWICDNNYIDNDVEVRDHCHIKENMEALHMQIVMSNFDLNHQIPWIKKMYELCYQ